VAADGSTRNRPKPPFSAEGPPLGFLLASVGFGVGYKFREVLAPSGIHPREFAVLRQVAADEGSSQQACAAALKVAPSQMVALVDELERKGLIERRTHASDRRVRALHLTAGGRRALVSAYQVAGRNETALFGALSDAERDELRRLLQTVAGALGIEPGTHPGMGAD
jgi:DNA-binding MarR family transcriptional regulator